MVQLFAEVSVQNSNSQADIKNDIDTEIGNFYSKILSLIPKAQKIKDLNTISTVRYQMRDEINNAIIYATQFLRCNKFLINKLLFHISVSAKDTGSIMKNIEISPLYKNDVVNVVILKSLQILNSLNEITIDFAQYEVFKKLGGFSKKINFLFNINELTYPEHLMISYDATNDIEYLKVLINYLNIKEDDEKNLMSNVKKINFESISESEKDIFKRFVFIKHVRNIIKSHIDLFKDKKKELLNSANILIKNNFEKVLKEN